MAQQKTRTTYTVQGYFKQHKTTSVKPITLAVIWRRLAVTDTGDVTVTEGVLWHTDGAQAQQAASRLESTHANDIHAASIAGTRGERPGYEVGTCTVDLQVKVLPVAAAKVAKPRNRAFEAMLVQAAKVQQREELAATREQLAATQRELAKAKEAQAQLEARAQLSRKAMLTLRRAVVTAEREARAKMQRAAKVADLQLALMMERSAQSTIKRLHEAENELADVAEALGW